MEFRRLGELHLQYLCVRLSTNLHGRPRESFLNKEETAKVVKNLKKYEREFDNANKELAFIRQLDATR